MIKKNYKKIEFWIILFLTSMIIFKINTNKFILYEPTNATITSMKKATSAMFNSIKFFFVDYIDLVDIKKENKVLVNKNRILMIENSLLLSYKVEIENLKSILNLKKSYIKLNLAPIKQVINSFTKVNNNLIAENVSNEVLQKDLGVITSKGVIGVIDKVSGNKIKIIPITSSKISIPVWVGKNKVFAFVTGVNNKTNLTLKLKYVENGIDIKPKDKIITNGYDSIFPEGISVGEVVRVKEVKNNIFVSVEVKLPKELYDSKYFFVIKR